MRLDVALPAACVSLEGAGVWDVVLLDGAPDMEQAHSL